MVATSDLSVVRILAPNPGPFTGPGTNSYVIRSRGEVLVLDPGPVIDDHLAAIVAEVAGSEPVAVVVTHTHPDHAPAANLLGSELGAPVIGFGPGPEFIPDRTIGDGASVTVGGHALVAVHTPGHTPDHLCFRLGDALFSGDHIMSGSTVIVEDLASYMASLRRLRRLDIEQIYPGHGPEIADGPAVIEEYITHREQREAQVLTAIRAGADTVDEIVDAVYEGLAPALREAARFQVRTQLRKLADEGEVKWLLGEAERLEAVDPEKTDT